MKKLFILSLILVFAFGCSNDENEPIQDVVNELNVPFEISDMRPLVDNEVDAVSKFLSTKKGSFDLEEAQFVSYEDLQGNSVFIPTYDEDNKSNYDIVKTTLLFLDDEQNIIDYAIHEQIAKEFTLEINIYNSQKKVINTIVDKETFEILEVNYLNDSSKGGWSACASCAAKSCANDGECAFICGIIWKECLSAIAVACLFSDLEC